ncbi:hypothetical protein FQA47_016406 [Oryzias melastigma]|uniref:Uncharacterized protein n=1 Tax=Oryzias melastigma TaxID=30732 RepID=A0A834FQ29_ORYME|nr:hypothetical protein FQA47_016406 [Oryzias melastigma]
MRFRSPSPPPSPSQRHSLSWSERREEGSAAHKRKQRAKKMAIVQDECPHSLLTIALQSSQTTPTDDHKTGTRKSPTDKISGWKRETESVKRKQVKKILDWTIEPRSLTSHLVNLGTKGQSFFTEPGDTLLPSQEPHLPVALKGMAPIRDSVSHSPNQTGLDHPGLDSQYEPSPWSSGSPCSSDSSSNWGKVLVDGNTDKSNNPCSDPELASECTDADSSSSIGSDKNLGSVAAPTVMMISGNVSSVTSSAASTPLFFGDFYHDA